MPLKDVAINDGCMAGLKLLWNLVRSLDLWKL
jgi:hypothetical protein